MGGQCSPLNQRQSFSIDNKTSKIDNVYSQEYVLYYGNEEIHKIKAIIIQNYYRAYKNRQRKRKFSKTCPEILQSQKIQQSKINSDYARTGSSSRQCTASPLMLMRKHTKNPSQESYRPRVTHLPDQSVANKMTETLADYPLKVQQTLLKIGLFRYKDYIKDPQSAFYNPTSDDNNLPFLEPYLMENGNIYVGQWKQGKRYGKGKYICINESIYEGFWKDDQPCGMGRLIFFNGNNYLGDWNQGQSQGQGQLSHADGSIQKGMWQNNLQHGYGEEKWIDGTHYIGLYKNGCKSGFGNYYWEDGSSFEGNFEKNMFEGYGVYKWSDGREVQVIGCKIKCMARDPFNGQMEDLTKGRYCQMQQFKYFDDLKQGEGQFIFNNGNVYKGQWDLGKMNGCGSLIEANGLVKKGVWSKGKQIDWLNK